MKQKGTVIDTSSERSISKTWEGLPLLSFCFDDKKIEYTLTTPVEDDKAAGGKGAKKDTKKDAKKPAPAAGKGKIPDPNAADESNPDNTKNIKSFKTYRQKSANSWKTKMYDLFKAKFT